MSSAWFPPPLLTKIKWFVPYMSFAWLPNIDKLEYCMLQHVLQWLLVIFISVICYGLNVICSINMINYLACPTAVFEIWNTHCITPAPTSLWKKVWITKIYIFTMFKCGKNINMISYLWKYKLFWIALYTSLCKQSKIFLWKYHTDVINSRRTCSLT